MSDDANRSVLRRLALGGRGRRTNCDGRTQLTAEDDVGPGAPDPVFNRMTFTVNADGSVRQFGEASSDRGATWTVRYDFTYRRGTAN